MLYLSISVVRLLKVYRNFCWHNIWWSVNLPLIRSNERDSCMILHTSVTEIVRGWQINLTLFTSEIKRMLHMEVAYFHLLNALSVIIIKVKIRIKFFSAFRTYPMRELGIGTFAYVFFNLVPVSLIISYFFTIGTDGNQSAQGLNFRKRIRSLSLSCRRASWAFFRSVVSTNTLIDSLFHPIRSFQLTRSRITDRHSFSGTSLPLRESLHTSEQVRYICSFLQG